MRLLIGILAVLGSFLAAGKGPYGDIGDLKLAKVFVSVLGDDVWVATAAA